MTEALKFGNILDDIAEGRLDVAAGEVDVATEPAHPFDLQRIIEFQLLFERGTLGFGERIEDELADTIGVQHHIVQPHNRAVDAGACRSPGAEVKV